MKRPVALFSVATFSIFLMGGVTAAHAEDFTFTASGSGFSATGTLTTVPDTSIPNAFWVTGVSVNGIPTPGLTICSPTSPSSACSSSGFAYDDLIYYPTGSPSGPMAVLDSHGIAFDLGTSALLGILGTTEVVGDLSAYNSTQDVFSYLGESSDDAPILVSLSIVPASVATTPEPGSLLLLGTGLLGVAGTLRRRLNACRLNA